MKRKLAKLIYLSGSQFHGYTVRVSAFYGMQDIEVTSALVGHAIVRALREVAAKRLDWFPPSSLN